MAFVKYNVGDKIQGFELVEKIPPAQRRNPRAVEYILKCDKGHCFKKTGSEMRRFRYCKECVKVNRIFGINKRRRCLGVGYKVRNWTITRVMPRELALEKYFEERALCTCDCGEMREIRIANLRSGYGLPFCALKRKKSYDSSLYKRVGRKASRKPETEAIRAVELEREAGE